MRWGEDDHIRGFFPQGVTGGEVSGARVSGGGTYRGKTLRVFHVPPLPIQGGGGSRGGGIAALL